MNANPWVQLALFLALLFPLAWALARWLDGVFSGRSPTAHREAETAKAHRG